jgi:hypothetical protein
MRLGGSKAILNDSTRRLMADWARTKEAWRDGKAAEFEGACLADIHERVNMAMQSLEKLDRLIDRIHKECGD